MHSYRGEEISAETFEDGSEAATTQGMLAATRSGKMQGTNSRLEPPEEGWPCRPEFGPVILIWIMASRIMREQISVVISHQDCGHWL